MNTARRDNLVIFLATGGFTGFLPKMPGTWGTFAAVPLVLFSHRGGPTAQLLIAAGFSLAAVWLAGRAEGLLKSRDASVIVIDEMSGFLVSLLWLPLSVGNLALGFVLFRFFDIVKPPPVRRSHMHLTGGLGVVADDILAGIYTNICLRLLALILSRT